MFKSNKSCIGSNPMSGSSAIGNKQRESRENYDFFRRLCKDSLESNISSFTFTLVSDGTAND